MLGTIHSKINNLNLTNISSEFSFNGTLGGHLRYLYKYSNYLLEQKNTENLKTVSQDYSNYSNKIQT